jgi:hypothetical protein
VQVFWQGGNGEVKFPMSTEITPSFSKGRRAHVDAYADSQIANGLSSVELACGGEMHAWLGVSENIKSWNALYDMCSWSTPFLSSQFFCAWESCYDDVNDPLLAIGKSASGAVVAIMPLARAKGYVTGAGLHQAEYQGWLSDATFAVRFFQEVLRCIHQSFPLDRVSFKYLPPKLPRQILEGISKSNPCIMTHSDVRPILQLDVDEIGKTLAKKATKSKLNRLKRAGELTFKRLSTVAELEQCQRVPVRIFRSPTRMPVTKHAGRSSIFAKANATSNSVRKLANAWAPASEWITARSSVPGSFPC